MSHPNDEDKRYTDGLKAFTAIDDEGARTVITSLNEVAPDLAHHLVAFGFGDIFARPGLDPKRRQLVTLGMLTALGGCEAQLEFHINASLKIGLTATEIMEVFMQSVVYCGFPKTLNAIGVAKKVLAAHSLLPSEQVMEQARRSG